MDFGQRTPHFRATGTHIIIIDKLVVGRPVGNLIDAESLPVIVLAGNRLPHGSLL